MNAVQKAIMDRRSTRGFDDTPITDDKLQALIDAALQSPSAMNKQPWHFAFIKDKELLHEFSEASKARMLKNASEPMRTRFADPDYDLLMGAPLFVVISVPEEQDGPFTGVDCGIAVENLALSAWGMGLGSVIVGLPREVFYSDAAPYFKKKMGIPANDRFVIGIVIGKNNVTKEAHPITEGRYSVV